MASGEATNTNFSLWFNLTGARTHDLRGALGASTLTITPPMWSLYYLRLRGKNIYISRILMSMPVLDQSRHYHNRNNLFLWWISGDFKLRPVLDQSMHYHRWNNLFLWLISGVASIETTDVVSSVKKTKKIRRFICFLIKQKNSVMLSGNVNPNVSYNLIQICHNCSF